MMKSSEFFLPGGRDGVLLIHGLTGTPAEMRFVGKGLHRQGYSVLGMQLAGHCGSEDDLLATGWRDWYRSVTEAADRLAGKVDRLFVGGLSMGAILALKLAADRPEQVSGLALYGTTFAYDGWTIPPIARLSFLLPLAMRLGIGRKKKFMEKPPYGIKCERVRQRIASSMLAGDSAAGGLPGNPWPSLAEFYRLSSRVPQAARSRACALPGGAFGKRRRRQRAQCAHRQGARRRRSRDDAAARQLSHGDCRPGAPAGDRALGGISFPDAVPAMCLP